jgi:hypothetical protein
MLASLSPESQIKRILFAVDCAESNFAAIVGGITSPSRLAKALSGQYSYDHAVGQHLLAVAKEMKELQEEILAPINWRITDKIQYALVVRRAAKIEQEEGRHGLDGIAESATSEVTK